MAIFRKCSPKRLSTKAAGLITGRTGTTDYIVETVGHYLRGRFDGYNVFVETSGPSKHGYWGGKRFTGDENPRWSKYVEWNNAHTGTWEVRDKDTFVGQL